MSEDEKDVRIVNLNQAIEIIIEEIRYTFDIMLIKDDCVIIGLADNGKKSNIKLKRWDELDILVGGKAKGVLYRCKSSVFGKIDFNGQTLYSIKHPIPISSINRREYYRHTLKVPAIAHMLADNLEDVCYIDNISAGGLRIVYKGKIEIDNIKIEFILEGGDTISCNCHIVHKGYQQWTPTNFYCLKFEDIDKKDQEKIIAFIFRKMISEDK